MQQAYATGIHRAHISLGQRTGSNDLPSAGSHVFLLSPPSLEQPGEICIAEALLPGNLDRSFFESNLLGFRKPGRENT